MQTKISHPGAQPFWDRIAPKYAQKPIGDPGAYEEKLAQVGSLLRATDRILEIGCGTGSTALRLAPGVAYITATDASRGMIEIAQSKLGPADTPANVTFHQADAADLVQGHPFDAICAFSLLHLIEDVPHVLGRVREQLKPGGLFISKTECLKDRTVLLRAMVPALVAMGIAPRVTALSTGDLHGLLRAAGFEIEHTRHFGAKRMSPFIVARRTAA
jgi:ubiquinone/menaquinone biosynthesis C-methylase UbiE